MWWLSGISLSLSVSLSLSLYLYWGPHRGQSLSEHTRVPLRIPKRVPLRVL